MRFIKRRLPPVENKDIEGVPSKTYWKVYYQGKILARKT